VYLNFLLFAILLSLYHSNLLLASIIRASLSEPPHSRVLKMSVCAMFVSFGPPGARGQVECRVIM